MLLITLVLPAHLPAEPAQEPALAVRKVTVSHDVELHYVERGTGVPVIFVHGSLSDGSYWNNQVDAFAKAGYRAIAYSRRYSPPNNNKARPGYSAVVDAEDLAAFIIKLHLDRVHVVGHSYGALAALFLASRHPELVRTLVLAEGPAVSLLEHLQGEQAATGKAMFTDIEQRMVKPMKAAFQKGDRESGLRIFINYVLDDPNAWQKMPQDAHKDMLAHAHEWDVMMSSGELFPKIEPQAIRAITTPTLLLSGERSYPFLGLIDQELTRLLPHARRIILRGATHRMWFEQPETCRNAVLDFLREPVSALARKENHSLRRPGSPTRASRDGVEACAQLLPRAGFFGSRDAMQRSANKKFRFYPKDNSARLLMLTPSEGIIS